jgi:hypothetical protein
MRPRSATWGSTGYEFAKFPSDWSFAVRSCQRDLSWGNQEGRPTPRIRKVNPHLGSFPAHSNPQENDTSPLLTTHSSLLTAHYSLLTAHCSLLAAHCSLLTAHCSLFTTYCLPLTTRYSLLTAHCPLFTYCSPLIQVKQTSVAFHHVDNIHAFLAACTQVESR